MITQSVIKFVIATLVYLLLPLLVFADSSASATNVSAEGGSSSSSSKGSGFADFMKAIGRPLPTGTPLLQTKLHNILMSNLATSGEAPEWPKIAIEDLQIPPNQSSGIAGFRKLNPNECIYFNATLWTDETISEKIENVSLCAKDFPRVGTSWSEAWVAAPIPGKNTGQLRTSGPVPPFNKAPSDGRMISWINSRYADYYLANLLIFMGYDPNYTPDTRRVWFVNVK